MNIRILGGLFLLGAPILLLLLLVSANKNSSQYRPGQVLGTQIYAALPPKNGTWENSIIAEDSRVKILERHLSRVNAPLATAAAELVAAADKYDIDFRLLAAISRQESAGCKIIPPGSHNCWGWGIHERGTLHFDSLEHGIDTVSKGLKQNYIDKGLVTPEQIMSKYTPSSPGTWAHAVRTFMEQME